MITAQKTKRKHKYSHDPYPEHASFRVLIVSLSFLFCAQAKLIDRLRNEIMASRKARKVIESSSDDEEEKNEEDEEEDEEENATSEDPADAVSGCR